MRRGIFGVVKSGPSDPDLWTTPVDLPHLVSIWRFSGRRRAVTARASTPKAPKRAHVSTDLNEGGRSLCVDA